MCTGIWDYVAVKLQMEGKLSNKNTAYIPHIGVIKLDLSPTQADIELL